MQFIFSGICFIGSVAAMLLIKSLNLSAGLTATLVVPLILLVIYSMARIQSKDSDTVKPVLK